VEHLSTFGLLRDPFANEPQLASYFEGLGAAQALRRLTRGLRQAKGLCVLSGPGGSGKTMLVRHLLESLEEDLFEACMLVPVPGVSTGAWLLDRFAQQLGVEEPAADPSAMLAQIYEQLAVVREDGRHTVLIIDEAQVLADQGLLRELRGLSNLEYEDRRLLSLVLVGLPALERALADEPALADRVDLRVRLAPLDEEASAQYLAQRIRCAGGAPAVLEAAAVAALVKTGAGNPRRLNNLADGALFEAHLAGRAAATAEDVERAAAELGLELAGQGELPPAAAAAGRDAARAQAPPSHPWDDASGSWSAAPRAVDTIAAEAGLASLFDDPAPDDEIGEVFAADTSPPAPPRRDEAEETVFFEPEETASRRGAQEPITALLDDGAAEGESEIDDLFADLVQD
jgi:type II secretory pathway predicted ATPase ExeA